MLLATLRTQTEFQQRYRESRSWAKLWGNFGRVASDADDAVAMQGIDEDDEDDDDDEDWDGGGGGDDGGGGGGGDEEEEEEEGGGEGGDGKLSGAQEADFDAFSELLSPRGLDSTCFYIAESEGHSEVLAMLQVGKTNKSHGFRTES